MSNENDNSTELKCESCHKEIEEGEVYTARTLSRERMQNNQIDVLHCEYTEVLCSDCSSFRGCAEQEDERHPEEGPSGRRAAAGYDARERFAKLLLRTANELLKGEDGLLLGVAIAVAGKDGAFKAPGPLTGIHLMRSKDGVPRELFEALAKLERDAKTLDAGGDS